MVDINDIYKSNSNWLKAEDIGTQMWTVTIQSADVETIGSEGDRKIVLTFGELDKSMPLNVTNARAIADIYGHNSNDWLGKQIMLFSMPVKFQDRMVNAIRIRAPGQASAPQRQATPQQYDELNPPPPTGNDYATQAGGR